MSKGAYIRDLRGRRITMIEYIVQAHYRPLMGTTSADLYHFLCTCWNPKTNPFISYDTIQDHLGMAPATVSRVNLTLTWLGLVEIVPPEQSNRRSNEYCLLGSIPPIDKNLLDVFATRAKEAKLPKSNERHRELFLKAIANWKPLFGQYELDVKIGQVNLHPVVQKVFDVLNVDEHWARRHGELQEPERVLAHAWYTVAQESIKNPAAFLQSQLQRYIAPPTRELALAKELVANLDSFEPDTISDFLSAKFTHRALTSRKSQEYKFLKFMTEEDLWILVSSSTVKLKVGNNR